MSEVRRTGAKAVTRRLWRSRCIGPVAVPVSIGLATLVLPVGTSFGLHAPDHHGIELGAVGREGAGETLAVEQFQQGSKALAVAVVGRRGQEQLVFEMMHHRADGDRTH